MYDKVKLWLDRCYVGDAYPHITALLDDANESTNLKTGEVKTFGSLQGMKVSLLTSGLYIVGSLPKLMYGSNIYPLDTHTTADAITKIEDALHLSLDEAKITGFEFGCTFVMKSRPRQYLEQLGNMPRLERYCFNSDTLYYKSYGNTQPKTFVYYDKIADAKRKRMEIPQGLEDANLLRAELRLNGRLSHQLNVPEVTAKTLSERPFYKMVMQRFVDSYFSITKVNVTKRNAIVHVRTVNDAISLFDSRLFALSGCGQEYVDDFLKELKAEKVFKDRVSYTRLKQSLCRRMNKANLTEKGDLMKELDDCFNNCRAYV